MTRALTSAVQTAIAGANVPLMIAVELAFDSGYVRVNNSGQNFVYGGNTFIGIGAMGSIDAIKEGGNLEAYGIALTLSGIDPGMIAMALGENCQGRACKVWLTFLDENYTILNDPLLPFDGRMDTMSIELGETAAVTVTAESRLIDLERPRVRRYNHEDQIAQFPSDKGLEFVALAVEHEVLWGRG
jgi:hypothetical protein